MTFRIVIQPAADEEIERCYRQISVEAPETALRWYNGLVAAIESLRSLPSRCPIAPENVHFPFEIRQLLYGRKGRRYRALFTIRDDVVHVLHFRHWARRLMDREEIRAARL